jgi:hypothetical protein
MDLNIKNENGGEMEILKCNQIQCIDISIYHIDKPIELHVIFENDGNFYDVYLNYFNTERKWNFGVIYHRDRVCCSHCKKNLPSHYQLDYRCIFYSNYTDELTDILLSNPTIQEKIKNFRLEALTNGFNL